MIREYIINCIILTGFSLVTILNVIVGTVYLIHGDNAFFIVNFCVFGIEKITLIFTLSGERNELKHDILYFCDIIQVGWIYGIIKFSLEELKSGFILVKHVCLLLLLFAQVVMFFGTDLILYEGVQDTCIPELTYTTFLITLFVFCFTFIVYEYKMNIIDLTIRIYTSYIILANLLMFSPNIGIKLGYYTLVFGLITKLLLLIPNHIYEPQKMRTLLIGAITQTPNYFFVDLTETEYERNKQIKLEDYFNQYGRIVLQIFFGFDYLISSDTNTYPTTGESMKNNIIIGFIFGLIYFLNTLQDFIHWFFGIKIWVFDKLDIDSIKKVPQKRGLLKVITFSYKRTRNYDCQNCLFVIEFLKRWQNLSSQGVIVVSDIILYFYGCGFHFVEFASHTLEIPQNITSLIYPRDRERILKVYTENILYNRYLNGFYNSYMSNEINHTLLLELDRLDKNRVINFINLISTTFSIYTFYYQISDILPINYTHVLFDLYQM